MILLKIQQEEVFGRKVRLKYAMSINYVGRMFAMIINVFFVLIITRKLTILEFSAWIILSKFFGYTTIFTAIYVLWTRRAISRGWNVTKNALKTATILGGIVSLIGLAIMFYIAMSFAILVLVVILFAIIIFEEYILRALLAVSSGYKPEYIGFYHIISSSTKVATAYILILIIRMGLLGAVIALMASKFIALSVLFWLNRNMIVSSSYDREISMKWIQYSWYPLAVNAITAAVSLDVILVKILTGNDLVISYYGVVFFLTYFIASPVEMRSALSAKILARRNLNDIDEAFWMILLFMLSLIHI